MGMPYEYTHHGIMMGAEETIKTLYELVPDDRKGLRFEQAMNRVKYLANRVERETGRWLLWNYPGDECAKCSACGEQFDQMDLYIGGNTYPKFCPECGAKMEVVNDG